MNSKRTQGSWEIRITRQNCLVKFYKWPPSLKYNILDSVPFCPKNQEVSCRLTRRGMVSSQISGKCCHQLLPLRDVMPCEGMRWGVIQGRWVAERPSDSWWDLVLVLNGGQMAWVFPLAFPKLDRNIVL